MSASPAKSADSSFAVRTKDVALQQKTQKQAFASTSPHQTKSRLVTKNADIANSGVSVIVEGSIQKRKKKARRGGRKKAKNVEKPVAEVRNEAPKKLEGTQTWKLSPFLGGRYLGLDPVFSKDEKHLLVAQALSLKIYSTTTSLLVRAIPIPASLTNIYPWSGIVSYFLDPRSDNRVYVATANSRLYLFNLADGKQIYKWKLGLGSLRHVCVCPDQGVESSESEVVYAASESPGSGSYRVTRISLSGDSVGAKVELYHSNDPVVALRVADAGRAVCLIAKRNIVVLNSENWQEPRIYPMGIPLTCMDIYLPGSSPETTKKSKKGAAWRNGDIAVGDSNGAIYVLHDVIKFRKVETDPRPMKLHWHRMAVSSVKWALNGTYLVSGGQETVLVIWQRETGHKQYLPHLGATIKNIVVSPRGSTYAVTLSDNSIMALSTSELRPKANIAGIQSTAQIRRNTEFRTVPCLLHPAIANKLLIATPSNQLDQSAASPYLQTFDTYSDRHISRQALTRTNATVINQTPDKATLLEPDIVFLAATKDGKWLASVDEWQPSKRNALDEEAALSLHPEKKREVFLKFWKWSEIRKEWELITRVDAPHPSPEGMGAEVVLDLIAAPNGHTFATVGSDGCVKIWKPKVRARPGSTDTSVNWGFRKVVNFSKRRQDLDTLLTLTDGERAQPPQWWGNVAFSEDSSLLAVSCPDPGFCTREDSLIHLIDPSSGSIRQSLGGLHIGRTTGLTIIERYLVVAGSQKLLVWNLVHGRVGWEYATSELTSTSKPTLHLAADHKDRTFAVAFSMIAQRQTASKIFVWGPVSDPNPVFTQNLEASVAALKSAGEGRGYVVLDRQARVQYVTPLLAAHASVASIVASGQEVEAESAQMLSGLYITDKTGEAEMMDVDGGVEKVVAREALEGVFDEVEIYEQGSVEAAFERVMGLFSKAPLRDEDEEEREKEDSDLELKDAGDEDEDEG